MFQAYDIISCDASCDCGHMPLHYFRNKQKIKIKKNKIQEFKYIITSIKSKKYWIREMWERNQSI